MESNRDRPVFFDLFDLALERSSDIAITAGQESAVVTYDGESRAQAQLTKLAPGWSYSGDCSDATVEMLVLEGEVTSDGESARGGGYVFLGQGYGDAELKSEGGATVIVMHNPDMPLFPPPHGHNYVLSSWREPWRATPKPGIEEHGSFHKSLRLPDFREPFHGGPGGLVRLSMLMPGYADGRQHIHHDCYEEIILLRGDLLMPERGLMGPGSFLGNPQEFWHAPVVSLGGALLLVHTDAPQGPWSFRPYPEGDSLADEYLDGTPWMASAGHTDWGEMPSWREWTERPAYEEWRAGPDSDDWSDVVGRGQAAEFRQRRRAAPPPATESDESHEQR